jgi:hypothetical protein
MAAVEIVERHREVPDAGVAADKAGSAGDLGVKRGHGGIRGRRKASAYRAATPCGTASPVIDGLEDSEDYRGFEAAIIADYDAETAVEREFVLRLLRLASLLWRLRRIIAQTDLFQIQAEILRDRRVHGGRPDRAPEVPTPSEGDRLSCSGPALSPRELTHCFIRLGNLDSGAFERLGRYNAALWKQTAQTLFLLGSIPRR